MCNSSRKIQLRGIKLLSNGSKVVKAILYSLLRDSLDAYTEDFRETKT